VSFGHANRADLRFEVARSDWFSRVLEPIGTVEYISTEIVLPRDDTALKAAVDQIPQSRERLRLARGPCRVSLLPGSGDALPGAKQENLHLADRP
jgi:hypothetical protein